MSWLYHELSHYRLTEGPETVFRMMIMAEPHRTVVDALRCQMPRSAPEKHHRAQGTSRDSKRLHKTYYLLRQAEICTFYTLYNLWT